MTFRDAGRLLKDAGVKFWDDKCPRLGAALAFYTTLSLSPLLLAVIALAGAVYGEEAARGELVEQLHDAIGREGAAAVEQMVAASAKPGAGTWAGVIAIVVLFFAATGVFSDLQSALNTIWKVPADSAASPPGLWAKAWKLVRERLLSFSLVCGVAFLLLVSLVITAVLSAVGDRLGARLPGWESAVDVAWLVIGFGLTAALFALIFKWLPDAKLAWRDVIAGAVVTAVLFTVGRYLIGFYLGKAAVGSAYGAAGAFVVLLVWVYWSTQILLFGAEFTFVYATRRRVDRPAVDPLN